MVSPDLAEALTDLGVVEESRKMKYVVVTGGARHRRFAERGAAGSLRGVSMRERASVLGSAQASSAGSERA